jgi:hypothetical protein
MKKSIYINRYEVRRVLNPEFISKEAIRAFHEHSFNSQYLFNPLLRDSSIFRRHIEEGLLAVLVNSHQAPEELSIYDENGEIKENIPPQLTNHVPHKLDRDDDSGEQKHQVKQNPLPAKQVNDTKPKETGGDQGGGGGDHLPEDDDTKLAKSEGASLEQMEARKKVAKKFMEENHFTDTQIETAIGSEDGTVDGGFDLTKPIEIVSFPPPEMMGQYVRGHGYPGNWFDPIGNQPATSLGLSNEGRTYKSFKAPKGKGLKGVAKSVVDTWTNKKNRVKTEGGGTQLFVNDNVKTDCIKFNIFGDG